MQILIFCQNMSNPLRAQKVNALPTGYFSKSTCRLNCKNGILFKAWIQNVPIHYNCNLLAYLCLVSRFNTLITCPNMHFYHRGTLFLLSRWAPKWACNLETRRNIAKWIWNLALWINMYIISKGEQNPRGGVTTGPSKHGVTN